MTDKSSLNLLAIGYHPEIMQVVHRLINSHNGWNGTIANSLEQAATLLHSNNYDGILLCAGVNEADEAQVRNIASNARIIRHYGGGSGLLENEIRIAFEI
ncbi:hypothetical protein SAMN05444266_108224 [Chitinophaga jiangningensis]|uniref:Response regulatory domain-containing protein n=1 Tax=Chitinophaga jiangningensis TaxID=1419482 RepID=A0A1M7J500_9BACT|nr:hypothetical protein [Chitinophaga jiangningensis]SHM48066.1 hypothetical protein SAMN05444266_108224 [Chitinophaga jiangningensis]